MTGPWLRSEHAIMEAFRYYLALLLLLFMPGLYVYWFSIHPFVKFWRKVGPHRTIVLHGVLIAVVATAIFPIRKRLLSVEFGTNWTLVVLAVCIYVFVLVLRVKLGKRLGPKVLLGLPELAPERYGRRLVTEGIYARLRHPRYLQIFLAILSFALVANYLAAYAILLVSIVWILLLVRMEEKELREHFGPAYDAYCARVPRFIPRF